MAPCALCEVRYFAHELDADGFCPICARLFPKKEAAK